MSNHANDDFPYKNRDPAMLARIGERFRALMRYVPRFMVMRAPYAIANAPDMSNVIDLRFAPVRAPMIMVLHARDYEKYNLISDYFIEHVRIRAYRGDDPLRESVYDYWRANRDRILARTDDVTNAREIVYREKMEVGTFRPTVMIGILELARKYVFGGARPEWILNPCAGWGDRLIGMLAYGVRGIVDVDPNPDLGREYERIEQWTREFKLASEHPYARRYFKQPFEDVSDDALRGALREIGCTSGEFDLAIIAPPYFDLEIYVPGSADQSIERYKTFESWYSEFLIPLIARSLRLLRIGGMVALIINQSQTARANAGSRFLRRMIHDINIIAPNARYMGVVSYAEVNGATRNKRAPSIRSPQPIWIWRRV